jgi:hypothetical protein
MVNAEDCWLLHISSVPMVCQTAVAESDGDSRCAHSTGRAEMGTATYCSPARHKWEVGRYLGSASVTAMRLI